MESKQEKCDFQNKSGVIAFHLDEVPANEPSGFRFVPVPAQLRQEINLHGEAVIHELPGKYHSVLLWATWKILV
jgi:hypothetical protein